LIFDTSASFAVLNALTSKSYICPCSFLNSRREATGKVKIIACAKLPFAVDPCVLVAIHFVSFFILLVLINWKEKNVYDTNKIITDLHIFTHLPTNSVHLELWLRDRPYR
jgi:hypothetical protein